MPLCRLCKLIGVFPVISKQGRAFVELVRITCSDCLGHSPMNVFSTIFEQGVISHFVREWMFKRILDYGIQRLLEQKIRRLKPR